VIVDEAGACMARCVVAVPVIATPAVRPIPTLKPARTISSRLIESSLFAGRIVVRGGGDDIRFNRDACCVLAADAFAGFCGGATSS
jgi:hypothetical protein